MIFDIFTACLLIFVLSSITIPYHQFVEILPDGGLDNEVRHTKGRADRSAIRKLRTDENNEG